MDPLSLAFTVVGAAWGVAADRVAARWPAHDQGAVRPVDWRTVAVAVLGGAAVGTLPLRFAGAPGSLLLFAAYFAALTLLLATDLDQRLLPDVVTLPLIPIALLVGALGWNPLVPPDSLVLALVAAVVIPAILWLVSVPFGAGAIGIGDLKLLVSVGLLSGLPRAVSGVVVGVLVGGVVIGVLLAARRISLRTYIPFGPFLIVGAYWAVLLAT